MNDKIYIHWNLPRQIHRDAARSDDFDSTVFIKSAHLQALKDGFIENNIEPIFNFRMLYFFNFNWIYSSKYYKYFFYAYNFIFGFIDNYLLYKMILKELKSKKIKFYYTELNPTITNSFLKSLEFNNIKSIEWFGLFPNQLNYNTRPNKTLSNFDLIVSGEDYRPFFKTKPKKFIKIPQAVPLKKIISIKVDPDHKIDVLFIGSISKIHSNRWDYLEYIYLNFNNCEFYGFGLEDVPDKYSFKLKFRSGLWGNEYYQKIKQAKIVLNLFQNDYENLEDGINIRAFEIPACKSLQLCKKVPFIKNYFKENFDIILFEDMYEMGEKIKYFIENKQERDEIVENSFNTIQEYDFPNHLKLTLKEV